MESLDRPQPAPGPTIRIGTSHEETPKVEQNEKDHVTGVATSQEHTEDESIVYPQGIHFALIAISQGLCAFLVGLVSSS